MNRSDGGEGRSGWSDESRKQASERARNRRPYQEGHSDKMSEMLRQRWSDPEFKAKMCETHKGRIKSEEHRQKIGASQKGKIVSEESKKKQSQTMKQLYANGREPNKGMLGRKLTSEQRERCRQAVLKRWADAKNRSYDVDG
jgi:hypothetical protein